MVQPSIWRHEEKKKNCQKFEMKGVWEKKKRLQIFRPLTSIMWELCWGGRKKRKKDMKVYSIQLSDVFNFIFLRVWSELKYCVVSHTGGYKHIILCSEGRGSLTHQNVDNHLQGCTVSQLKRPQPNFPSSWRPESHISTSAQSILNTSQSQALMLLLSYHISAHNSCINKKVKLSL